MIKKFLLALVNVLELGLGFALIGKLKKGLLVVLAASLIYLFGGLFNLYASFIGMIITYSLIIIVYLYAFCVSFDEKEIKFKNPLKNLLIYIPLSFIVAFSCVYPVKEFMYKPVIMTYEIKAIEPFVSKGDYMMTKKENGVITDILFVFWSKDKSKIGKTLNIKLPE